MRSVAIIAFFCLVASAVSFNITAYHVGWADQLTLNPQQIRNAATCQNSVKRTVSNAANLLTGNFRSIDNLVFTAMDVYNGAKRQVGVDCYAYLMDLAMIVMKQNPMSDPTVVAQQNLVTYNAEIIQQLAIWGDFLAAGNLQKAGSTQAYIFQIIFGIQKPTVLPKPVVDAKAVVPIDILRLIEEFIQSYLTNIGVTDQKTIQSSKTCLKQLAINGTAAMGTYTAASQASTIEEGLLASIGLYNQIIDLITPCATAELGLLAFSAPLNKILEAAPVFFFAQITRNFALKAPQVQQFQQQTDVDIQTGKYAHAGEVTAQVYKIMVNGLTQ